MTKFNARVSKFMVNDTNDVSRDLSEYLTNIDGLPGEVERPETTTLGDEGRKHGRGLENVTVTIEGFFDNATSGPDVVLGGLRGDDTPRNFEYGPEGDIAGSVQYSGTVKLRNYVLTSRVGDMITFRSELLVQGVVTRGSY